MFMGQSKKLPAQPEEEAKEGEADERSAIEAALIARYSRDQYPWLSSDTLKLQNIFLFLHSEILDFEKFISPTDEEEEARRGVEQRIKTVVKGIYPEAKVLVFGSCATKLYLPNSDIDILVFN